MDVVCCVPCPATQAEHRAFTVTLGRCFLAFVRSHHVFADCSIIIADVLGSSCLRQCVATTTLFTCTMFPRRKHMLKLPRHICLGLMSSFRSQFCLGGHRSSHLLEQEIQMTPLVESRTSAASSGSWSSAVATTACTRTVLDSSWPLRLHMMM